MENSLKDLHRGKDFSSRETNEPIPRATKNKRSVILEYKTLILERSLNPSRPRINETFRCSFEKRICHAKKKVGGEGRTGGRARNISRIYALDVVNERAVQLCDLRT